MLRKITLHRTRTEEMIAQAGAIAALLEVSGCPKPGNVHRTQDFGETHYEHFLISSVVIIPALQEVAHKGKLAQSKQIALNELNLGESIFKAVKTTQLWQKGGNTNLGIILLFVPLACAAGMLINHPEPSIELLRDNLNLLIRNSTSNDTVKLFEAIRLAKPGGLGNVEKFDIYDSSPEALHQEKMNLYEIFRISAERDSIAREWITKFQITFEIGYPYFKKTFQETNDINISVVHTYLKILGVVPDTLVARKHGKKLAESIGSEAKDILNRGGLLTKQSIELLWEFDLKLRNKYKINPGTSADLTAATIMVALLEGITI